MRITRYLAFSVLTRSAAALALFLAVYSAIDFVEMGAAIGSSAGGDAARGGLELLKLYPLRLPMIAAHILPLGLMIGVQTTLASLRSRGEWDSFRAAGLAPVALCPGLLIVPLLGAFFSWALLGEISPRALGLWESKLGVRTEIQAGRWCKRGGALVRETDSTGTALFIEREPTGSPRFYSFQSSGRADSWSPHGGWTVDFDAQTTASCGQKDSKTTSSLLGLEGASLTSEELQARIDTSLNRGWDKARLEAEAALRPSIASACLIIPLIALGLSLGGDEPRATRLVAKGVATAVVFWLFTAAAWNGASVGAWSPIWLCGIIPVLFFATGLISLLVNGRG